MIIVGNIYNLFFDVWVVFIVFVGFDFVFFVGLIFFFKFIVFGGVSCIIMGMLGLNERCCVCFGIFFLRVDIKRVWFGFFFLVLVLVLKRICGCFLKNKNVIIVMMVIDFFFVCFGWFIVGGL